jgi:hypothetical protein
MTQDLSQQLDQICPINDISSPITPDFSNQSRQIYPTHEAKFPPLIAPDLSHWWRQFSPINVPNFPTKKARVLPPMTPDFSHH